jgi:hypothetical protein
MDPHEFRHAFLMGRGRVNMKVAEGPPERQMLLGRKLLVPEEDDEVLEKSTMNFVQLLARRPIGEIDAVKLCSDNRCELFDLRVL